MRRIFAAAVGLSLLAAVPALANDDNWKDDPPEASVERIQRPHWLAVGAGVMWNQAQYYGLAGEYGGDPKLTYGGHLGLRLDPQDVMNRYGQRSIAIGATVNYYVLGTFDAGARLGAQFFAVNNHASTTGYSAEGSGTGGGLHAGARKIWPIGLTLEAEAGATLAWISEFTRNPNVPGELADAVFILPYVRASVGWAF
jgi:hypothetical protein